MVVLSKPLVDDDLSLLCRCEPLRHRLGLPGGIAENFATGQSPGMSVSPTLRASGAYGSRPDEAVRRQQIIHGFRTVVADVGAHKGYIISSNGFQSGSFSAADLTNIELVTWDEFQEAFEPTWLDRYFVPTITEELDPLMSYAEPFAPKWFWSCHGLVPVSFEQCLQ